MECGVVRRVASVCHIDVGMFAYYAGIQMAAEITAEGVRVLGGGVGSIGGSSET